MLAPRQIAAVVITQMRPAENQPNQHSGQGVHHCRAPTAPICEAQRAYQRNDETPQKRQATQWQWLVCRRCFEQEMNHGVCSEDGFIRFIVVLNISFLH